MNTGETDVALAKQLIAGTKKYFANVSSLTFANATLTPVQVEAFLQTRIDLRTAVDDSKAATKAKIVAEAAQTPALRSQTAVVLEARASSGQQRAHDGQAEERKGAEALGQAHGGHAAEEVTKMGPGGDQRSSAGGRAEDPVEDQEQRTASASPAERRAQAEPCGVGGAPEAPGVGAGECVVDPGRIGRAVGHRRDGGAHDGARGRADQGHHGDRGQGRLERRRPEGHERRGRRPERLRRDGGADENVREERNDERAIRVDEDVIGAVSRTPTARDLGNDQRERTPGRDRDPDAGPPDDAREGWPG